MNAKELLGRWKLQRQTGVAKIDETVAVATIPEESNIKRPRVRGVRYRALLVLFVFLVVVSSIILIVGFARNSHIVGFTGAIGLGATSVAFLILRRYPDALRTVALESLFRTFSYISVSVQNGFSQKECQKICNLLLDESGALAVSITDTEKIMGFSGLYADEVPPGSPIATQATKAILGSESLKGFSHKIENFPAELIYLETDRDERFPLLGTASIVVPLKRGDEIVGTLKFYYKNARAITDKQYILAAGFGEIMSNLLAAFSLEEQTRLAAQAELKALQSQINPHFLFNTLNTIAAFTRMHPERARDLLREFAVFFRSTLDSSETDITLEKEIEQTKRYLKFELARFGDDSILETVHIDEALRELEVPAFIVQPLVENAVRHARKEEEPLAIEISVAVDGEDVLISVVDDGIGIAPERVQELLASINQETAPTKESAASAGIALYNVQKRLEANFGFSSGIEISSEEGRGSSVTLRLVNAIKKLEKQDSSEEINDDAD